jgi:CubicO group peptidase (beta-lactamase class C family)
MNVKERPTMNAFGAAIFASAFLALVPAGASAQSAADPIGPAAAAAIDKIFAAFEGTTKPGCAAGVWKDGKVVYIRGFGMADLEDDVPITPETVFEAGSVSKQFSAAAVELLAREKKLALGDDIRTLLPEVPAFGPLITIRHLLTHTSGIRDQWNLLIAAGRPPGSAVHTLDEILDLVSRQRDLNFAPGDDYLYCNTGYALAAWVVLRASGRSLAEFSRERIFEPLGMAHTQWRDDFTEIVKGRATAYSRDRDGAYRQDMPFTNVYGNGGLLTTVGDLLIWAANFWSSRILDRDDIAAMETPAILNDGTKTLYGLGLNVGEYKGVREISHSGSTAGYRAFLARYPDQRTAVAILSNFSGAVAPELGRRVVDIVLADALKGNPKIQPVAVPAELIQPKAGLYRSPRTDAVLVLAFRDNHLWQGERQGQALLALGPSRFQTASGEEYVFEPSGEGKAPAVRVSSPGTAPVRFVRVEPARPTPERLVEYEGPYWSDELEVTYVAAVKDGKLTLRRRPDPAVVLDPTYEDGFVTRAGSSGGILIRFTRDARGRVDGFTRNSGRILNLKFIRK